MLKCTAIAFLGFGFGILLAPERYILGPDNPGTHV